MLPYFDPINCPDFGIDFLFRKEGILISVLHGNYNFIYKINVGF